MGINTILLTTIGDSQCIVHLCKILTELWGKHIDLESTYLGASPVHVCCYPAFERESEKELFRSVQICTEKKHFGNGEGTIYFITTCLVFKHNV